VCVKCVPYCSIACSKLLHHWSTLIILHYFVVDHALSAVHLISVVSTSASDCLVNNVLVKTAPDLNQSLFQFINALDVCIVNTFLNGCPYLIVN